MHDAHKVMNSSTVFKCAEQDQCKIRVCNDLIWSMRCEDKKHND